MRIDSSRIEALAARIAAGEAGRAAARDRARRLAEEIHREVTGAVARFAEAARRAGAPHLDLVEVGPVEPDDKSIRAFQFVIRRGRTRAVVVSKDRGEVMLVGPFREGGDQGPCRPFHLDTPGADPDDPGRALEALLVELIEQACSR